MEKQREEYLSTIREHLQSFYLLTDEKIESVMPKFLETIRKLMSELEQLARTGQGDALSRAGHAMKGSLLNLGLQELAQKAFQIEKHQEVEETGVNCCQLVEELKQEINKII